jgi:hypothetical protein
MDKIHSNTNTELAKDYISKRKIPQLFEVKHPVDNSSTIRNNNQERKKKEKKIRNERMSFLSGIDYRFDGSQA